MKARLPQGYGGGAASRNDMIRKAQKMQEELMKKQEAISAMEFNATAGGGAVEVTVSGDKELKSIKIDPEVINPDDAEMLEDLIVAAVNEGLRKVEDLTNQEMEKISGGLSIPGLL